MILLAIDPGKKPGWAVFDSGRLIACGRGLAPQRRIDRLVIERPDARGGRTNTPIEDLITLAIEAGRALGRHEGEGVAVELVRPVTWKGQTPKEISHARALAKLAPDERALLVGASADTLDAVALGLWACAR